MLGKSGLIGFPSGRSQGGTMLPWFRIGYRASRWAAASVVLGGGLLLDEGADRQGAFVLNVRFRDAKRTKLLKSPAANHAANRAANHAANHAVPWRGATTVAP